jgi:5-methylcytosine-specific restriction endonuclease McrA
MKLPVSQADALTARCRRILRDHKAMAKPRGIVLDYGVNELRTMLESSPCCRWCRLPVGFADLNVDHVHPLARGGAIALYNLCIACSRCNRLRSMLTEAETLELLEFLNGLHPAARQDLERRLLAGGERYARGRPGPRRSS